MSDEDFLKLVDAGIDVLREDVKQRMKNVAIVIADEPTLQQREENELEEGATLFGLSVLARQDHDLQKSHP